MPRTLPWLVQAAKKQETKQLSSSSSPAPRRKRASTPGDLVNADLNTTGVVTPERRKKRQQGRTPSTSPPPAPPDVEYMREGYTADDVWMMVEDEFYSTTQMFTQHIHHAEYVRLKKLAKSRGAGTLQAIARPTDGRTAQSAGTKLRLEAEANAKKIKDGMRGMTEHEESDEENDEYMQDPQLAGLMMGSQRSVPELTGIAKAKSKTRAAAGFSKSPHKTRRTRDAEVEPTTRPKKDVVRKVQRRPVEAESSDADSDDLDAPATKLAKPLLRSASDERHTNGVSSSRPSSGILKRFAKPTQTQRARSSNDTEAGPSRHAAVPEQQARPAARRKSPSPGSDSETNARTARSQATSDFLAKRRATREKKEQEEKRKDKPAYNEVPTFAI